MMMSNSLASLMQTLVMLTMAHCALWTKVAKRLEKEPKSNQNVQFIVLSFANFGHAHNGSLCTMEKSVYKILKKGKERRGFFITKSIAKSIKICFHLSGLPEACLMPKQNVF